MQPADRHSSEGRQKKSKNESWNQDKWKINVGKIKENSQARVISAYDDSKLFW